MMIMMMMKTTMRCERGKDNTVDEERAMVVSSDMSEENPVVVEETALEPAVTEQDTKTKQRKTKVSFSTSVTLQFGLRLRDYTDEELVNCWYTHAQYRQMRYEIEPTLMLINSNEFTTDDSEEHCARGLECRTKQGKAKRQLHRYMAYNAVLHQQQTHLKTKGVRDDEAISEAYIIATKQCKITALKQGTVDAMTVKNPSSVESLNTMVRKARQLNLRLRAARAKRTDRKGGRRSLLQPAA